MPWPVKSVHRALRAIGLKKSRKGHRNTHEVWNGGDGQRVELARRGNEVPDRFVHVLAWELDKKGLCPAREFKEMIREV
jgi:hypothetical protein